MMSRMRIAALLALLLEATNVLSAEGSRTYEYIMETCSATVPCSRCETPNPDTVAFTVSRSNNIVLWAHGSPRTVTPLHACHVADSENWTCGGFFMSRGKLGSNAGTPLVRLDTRLCFFQATVFGRRLVLDIE